MDLFEYAKAKTMENESPLASRLRPTRLEEVVGQQHIVGKDKLLYRAIKADKLTSVIFYGPPGTGKTTLAKVIANTTSADFTQINATVAGKKDMEEVVKQAQNALGMYGRKTILFIDEIHRFNKGQQDYLLPFVEDGTIILIGATTENPYFEVNGALLSRSIVFELKALEIPEIKELILRAVNDKGLMTARSILHWMWLLSVSRSVWYAMIRTEIIITTLFPHSLKACAAQTRMLQCIILRRCCMQGKM